MFYDMNQIFSTVFIFVYIERYFVHILTEIERCYHYEMNLLNVHRDAVLLIKKRRFIRVKSKTVTKI